MKDEDYSKSKAYLKEIPLKKSWFYLAKNYEAEGNNNEALELYKKGLKESSLQDETIENFKKAMYTYTSAVTGQNEKNKKWQEILSMTEVARDYVLYNIARTFPDENKSFK